MKNHFSKYGEVVSCTIAKDRFSGTARGFGFVTFALPAATKEALNDTHHINGKLVDVKKAEPALNISSSSVEGCEDLTNKKIFVGGLPDDLSLEEFKKYFGEFGNITDIVIMHDSVTNRTRGFGFVTFESEASIKEVTKKKFHQLEGTQVEVKMSVPKEISYMEGVSNFNFYNNINYFYNNYDPYRPFQCYGCGSMYPFGQGCSGGSGVYGDYNYMSVPTPPQGPWYYPQMVGARGSHMSYASSSTMMIGVQGCQTPYASSSIRIDSYVNGINGKIDDSGNANNVTIVELNSPTKGTQDPNDGTSLEH